MSKIRESAQGQECQVRFPGYCSFNPEETVFGHLNGYGIGGKHRDLFGAYVCAKCHAIIDGHVQTEFTDVEIKIMFLDGIIRTQQILLDIGLIKIPGSK